ncbi:molybdenum cofactor guanylyltransferase MobA [Dokdonella sp.]|uniref:molybdenum cofactor guanylyltransferase MobA n=1 Tax=Dokdonella sp. TaxID=2291710 RepID=UPI0025B8E138|nr:molybdenum cofactor guanylyltransferase MobA [Dokdonella sp.]MBX3693376.1 molybdenum cofactor guanylyltransferase [Dokdonella sp.]MCW5568749.1 molybdenum cofactor guanylyltransferase [Dokdonella sp.]
MNPVDVQATTAAILAGGRGERMGGVDKGLLEVDGQRLAERVLAALRGQGIDNVLIVANRSHDEYARLAPVVADAGPAFRGPLAGIAAALAVCATPWLLSVPVDCPTLPPDLFARLATAARSGAGAAVFVAHDGERRQPLFALYRRTLADEAVAALAANLGVHAWQVRIGACEVDFADMRAHFANLNTPAELAAHAGKNHDG